MLIRSARLLPYRLPLRQPWRSRHGVLRERGGWIVELTSSEGSIGLGDCAPLGAAGTETAPEAEEWLNRRIPKLAGGEPSKLLQELPICHTTPAARCALETALLDLLSRANGCCLRRWLNPRALDEIGVNASAGTLDDTTPERCLELARQGFRTLKLKAGILPMEQELERLQRLDDLLPGAIQLRLDANCAWEPDEAMAFISAMPRRVEAVEEPLKSPVPETLSRLQALTQAALALDESLSTLPLEKLLHRPPVRRLVLKPSVLGGLLPTLALAERAEQAGLQVLLTSTLESAVGIQAIAQLAAALPRSGALDHGLATSAWFAADVVEAPAILAGRIKLGESPGMGLTLNSSPTPRTIP